MRRRRAPMRSSMRPPAVRREGIRRVPERLPITLRAYRGLTAVATPFLPLVAAYRLRQGKEQGLRLRERRGESKVPRPDAPLVWVHAASVGEMLSVVPIVEHLGDSGFAV